MKYLTIFSTFLVLFGCVNRNQEKLTIDDIKIFEETPAWSLANALEKGDIKDATKLVMNDFNLVDVKDPIFGTTLLMRGVSTENIDAVKFLLKNGADPNIKSKTGTTALFRAISYSWDDVNANKGGEVVKILLDNGADPNIVYCSPKVEGEISPIECGTSPLMHAATRGAEKTRYLIEAGASINYTTKSEQTAAIKALRMSSLEEAYILIVENRAKVNEPYYFYGHGEKDTVVNFEKPYFPVDLLLDWIYPIGSAEYFKKQEIIQEFSKQGIDYQDRKKNINNLILRRIKKMYTDDWEKYLEEY